MAEIVPSWYERATAELQHWFIAFPNAPKPDCVPCNLWKRALRSAHHLRWSYWNITYAQTLRVAWDMRVRAKKLWTGPVGLAQSGLLVDVSGTEYTLTHPDERDGYWWAEKKSDKTTRILQLGAEDDSEALILQPIYQVRVEKMHDSRLVATCILTGDVICIMPMCPRTTLRTVRRNISAALACPNGCKLFNVHDRVLSVLEDYRCFQNLMNLTRQSSAKDTLRLELYDEEGRLYWHSQL